MTLEKLNELIPVVSNLAPDSAPFLDKASVRSFMRKYIALPRPLPSLLVRGPALCGKTWVASRIALELYTKHGELGTYTTLMDMVSATLEQKIPIGKFYNAKLLIVDNITTEKNAYAPSLLARVVRHRQDYIKTTILVSSLSDELFTALYGEEMQERVSQMLMLNLVKDKTMMERRAAKLRETMLETEDAS